MKYRYLHLRDWAIVIILLNLMIHNVYSFQDIDKIIDPMMPKVQEEHTTEHVEELKLKAVGHNDDIIYCIINDNILSVGDNILNYTVESINDDVVILVDLSGNRKLLNP